MMTKSTLPRLACIAALALCAIPAVASAQRHDYHDRGSRYTRGSSHGHGGGGGYRYNSYHGSYHGGGHHGGGHHRHHGGSRSSFSLAFGFSSGGYYGDSSFIGVGYRYGSPKYGFGIGATFPVYSSYRHHGYYPYAYAPPVVYRPAPVYYEPVYPVVTKPYAYGAPCYTPGPSYYRSRGDYGGTYVSTRFYYRR